MIAAGLELWPRPEVSFVSFVRLLTNFAVRVFSFGWCVAPLKLALYAVFASYIRDRNRNFLGKKPGI